MSNRIMAHPVRRIGGLAAAALAVSLVLPAAAQQVGSRQTREFVQAAAQSDEFEIMEAHTVLVQSTDPQVRAFAQQMLQAHQQTSASLIQAATRAGLEPPTPGLGGDQSAFLAALQSQRGADFDMTYVRQQVLAHDAALAVEQGYASSGDNPAIQQAAAATLPIIASHLQMAERMKASMGGS
jgi:putative membrane protein